MLLRESLATTNCRTTMIAHISDSPAHHAETLSTVQLAARIHRLRRKKGKVSPSSCCLPGAPRLPYPLQPPPTLWTSGRRGKRCVQLWVGLLCLQRRAQPKVPGALGRDAAAYSRVYVVRGMSTIPAGDFPGMLGVLR